MPWGEHNGTRLTCGWLLFKTSGGDIVILLLEPVINFPTGGAGSRFFSVPGARSDEYRESSSDERHRNEENRPQPEGLRRKGVPGTHVLGQNAACAKVNTRLWPRREPAPVRHQAVANRWSGDEDAVRFFHHCGQTF